MEFVLICIKKYEVNHNACLALVLDAVIILLIYFL